MNKAELHDNYQSYYLQAKENPQTFWKDQAQNISWHSFPTKIFEKDDNGHYQWFVDGELNTCYCALDAHIKQGRADQPALIYDSPVSNQKQIYSYQQLLVKVCEFSAVLKNKGVEKGDTVVIYMSMVPEAVIAMLACARIGAIHSVVFGGFAAKELAIRIKQLNPKVILATSCGIEFGNTIAYKPILNKAIELAEVNLLACIVYQREQCLAEMDQDIDEDWQSLVQQVRKSNNGNFNCDDFPAEMVNANHPLYVLFTSGTTGQPKGVVRDHGGHAVALQYSMSAIYNVQAGDVYFAASDVGWVVGHSYIVYAPLLQGCTTVLYEGKPVRTPDAGAFWRIVEEYKVKVLFSAPTAFRAIKREDSEGKLASKYDLSSLSSVFVAGERLDPATYHWLEKVTNKIIVDHWWQTETGWPIAANPLGVEEFKAKAGSATKPIAGFDVQIMSDDGQILEQQKEGNIVIKLPLPPGCLTGLWKDKSRFYKSYLSQYKAYYNSGDGGYFDKDGYLFVMGRIDDVINVAGHRLSTGQMEEIISAHHAVAECCVISRDDSLKGQLPVGLVVLKDNLKLDKEQLAAELVQSIRESVGAIACYKETFIVKRLPKTRSGKILRKTLRQMINDESNFDIPSTIDDVSVLEDIKRAFQNFTTLIK